MATMFWILFLPLLLVSTFGTEVSCSCIASERESLLDFKQNIQDPNATLTSWSGSDCCRWRGIECSNGTGHVIKLNLSNVAVFSRLLDDYVYPPGLQGQIVPSLCQLKHLQQLDLRHNSFSGQIPVFFGCFQELTYLNLSYNNFSGTIPPQLGNISKLQTLDLSTVSQQEETYFSFHQTELAVYDALWLKHLTSLQYLDMGGANLQNSTNFFQSLNVLPSLSIIRCYACRIRSLPESLPHVNFTSLTELDLHSNYIRRVPDWLFKLINLRYLDLKQQRHEDDPKTKSPLVIPFMALRNLSNLKFLDLSEVGLDGSISISLGKLSSLETLRLSNNRLRGPIPDILGSIQFLKELDLSSNYLSGFIPTSITKLSSLILLDLSDNNLRGTVPTDFEELLSLQGLDLSGNNLSGSIPTSLGRISTLLELDISYNRLNGSIPESFCRLSLIQYLDLSHNMLNGPIPESLCGLSLIQEIDLSNNYDLTGSIPECIGQLKELEALNLENTNLVGVISESHFANLTKLDYLRISSSGSLSMTVPWNWNPPFQMGEMHLDSCKMRTRFPAWIRNQTSLWFLSLTNAEIYGELPSWIWDLSELAFLNLSNNSMSGDLRGIPYNHDVGSIYLTSNRFEGNIPSSFCEGMMILDLSGNQLSGEIPRCLLGNQRILNLASNNLSGSIPNSTISEWCQLQSLRLENNNLSGILPSSLTNCFNMEALDISGNKLNGNIPTWLGENMPSLKILNLRSNNLSGSIPWQMSKLSSLRILDLAGNKLSGQIPYTFGNFTAMMSINASFSDHHLNYADNTSIRTKGQDLTYNVLLPFFVSIDLSSNQLSGKIPPELGSLVFLKNLNLSHNLLSDNIPTTICKLHNLESLDLSRNYHLSGQIPQCMDGMSALENLDLSYNNLSGRIPWDNQMATFSEEYFEGNVDLCGSPLAKKCETEQIPRNIQGDGKTYAAERLWVYLTIALGFIVGFWIFYGVLFFKEKWRYVYFQFLGDTNFMLYIRFKLLLRRVFK